MIQKDWRRALQLYKRYKCEGREYRELAAKYGMQITDLNAIISRHRQNAASRIFTSKVSEERG